MANFDKWTRGATGHMCKHFERAKDENGEYIKFGNRDIDTSRTHLNYNLAPERENQYGFIADRCKELKCLNRKDVNVLGSWIVTAPANLPDDKLRDFFQASYNALEKKYGKDNVVSAYVHMDESGRPHMHFAFVPVVWDKKKETWKVSAKECVSRKELQEFHPWLERDLQERLGYHVDVINEATRDGNKTVTELKRETEMQKQREIAQETQKATQELSEVTDRVKTTRDELDALKKPVADLRDVEELLERGKKGITGKTAYKKQDNETIAAALKHGATSDWQIKRLEDALVYERDRSSRLENQVNRLEDRVKSLKRENESLNKQVIDLVAEGHLLKAFIQSIANLKEKFEIWKKEELARQELEYKKQLEAQSKARVKKLERHR